jgi:hypothetical protein
MISHTTQDHSCKDKHFDGISLDQTIIKIRYFFTPSDAVMIECRFGMESALSIFTITCMSALQPEKRIECAQ